MFQIHGLTGRIARARAEELRQVGRASGPARAGAVTPVHNGLSDPASNASAWVHLHPHRDPSDQADDGSTRPAALQAYAQVQQAGRSAGRTQVSRALALHWMSTAVITLDDQQPLAEAVARLHEHGISQAPVLNQAGQLVGQLLLKDVASLPPDAPEPAVHPWMRTPVPSASPEIDLRQVAAALEATDLPGLALTEPDGSLAGFITRGDLLRALATEPTLDLWG